MRVFRSAVLCLRGFVCSWWWDISQPTNETRKPSSGFKAICPTLPKDSSVSSDCLLCSFTCARVSVVIQSQKMSANPCALQQHPDFANLGFYEYFC